MKNMFDAEEQTRICIPSFPYVWVMEHLSSNRPKETMWWSSDGLYDNTVLYYVPNWQEGL